MVVAMDAMAVAIHIKYLVGQNEHLTFYSKIKTDFLVDRSCPKTDGLRPHQCTGYVLLRY